MYTIYKGRLPDGRIKIGCDMDYPNRPIEQNMFEYFILEQHKDIMIASEREIQLQKEHGVLVDSWPYYMTKVYASKAANKALENGTHNFQTMSKEQRIKNAKSTTHFKNSEFQSRMAARNKGIPKPHSKELAKALNIEWNCEYCNKIGSGIGNFKRWGHNTGDCIKKQNPKINC